MTLSERNTFFKAGMIFCTVITLLVIAVSLLTVSIYSTMEENSRRPEYFFQYLTGWFLKTDYLAVHVSVALAVLFALLTIILIHYFFERTSVPEILYISLFTMSFSFEVIRLIVPLHLLYIFPLFYLTTAFRVLLFARYFGIFSLLAASVSAAGMEIQQMRNKIFFIVVSALIITLGVPIDTQTWDTCFNLIHGYTSMFTMIEIIAFIAAVVSFFVAVKVRRSGEYAYVGIGVIFALIGRNVLLGTDNWAGPVAGIFLLSFGIWFMCSKLHKIHLWL